MILGTAAYMSPEQARGREIDKRTDVWAFGCVLYEMMTGRAVFAGDDVSLTLARVLEREPDFKSLPGNLNPRVLELLDRCLQKDAGNRWHDIGDVRVDIQRVLADPSGVLVQPAVEVVQAAPQSKLPWVAALILAVITGVAVWNLRPTEPQPVAARFYHELPDGQSFTRDGRRLVAVSPDGSQIVYVANGQLHLRHLDEMAARPIQGTDEDPASPFFSPGGEWVGYFSAQDEQLKKIATTGGASVTLCDTESPFGASWGSDDIIVYGQPEGIMRVSANGGTPELVIPTEEGEQVHGPQMLPGGEWVLFTLTSGGANTRWDEAQIVAQSLESGERKILWDGGSDARYVPTGHLIYALEDVLFALPFDLASLEVLGGPVPVVEGIGRASSPARLTASANYGFSDRGTLIYVPGSTEGDLNILALADRSGVVEPLDVPQMDYATPRLSPDGSRLVVGTTDGDDRDIWVYDLSGDTQIRRLTLGGNNRRPLWAPDGERVTFTSDRDGTSSIYWQPADGSSMAERLTTAEEGTRQFAESWSPDGRTLALGVFRPGTNDGGVWTLSLESETTTPEVFADESESFQLSPTFSPDGRWLAYESGESGSYEVYVQPFPKTGAKHRITQQGGFRPLWSPDGKQLFYERTGQLLGIDISMEPAFSFGNEQALRMQGFLIGPGGIRYYDITPDGQRFLMIFPADQADSVTEIVTQRINVVLNWFEELKERVPVP